MQHAAVTKLWLIAAAVGGAMLTTDGGAHAQVNPAGEARLKRGDYLVTRAIGCAHCHTPRDADGRRLPGRDLTGAIMQYAPIKPVPNWAPFAPAIAGLPPGYTEAQMATFMETGLKPDGKRPRPPMPPFQLDREDALAIAAYLASLKPSAAR